MDSRCAHTLSRKRESKQSLCLCLRMAKGAGTGVVSVGVHNAAYLLTPEYGVYVFVCVCVRACACVRACFF